MTFADTMQQWNSSTWTNSQLSEFVVKTGLIAGEPLVLGHEHMNVQVMFHVIWESGFVTKKMIADHKPVLILINLEKEMVCIGAHYFLVRQRHKVLQSCR